MNIDDLDGRIGDGLGRGEAERQSRQRRARPPRQSHRGCRAEHARAPVTGAHPVLVCVGKTEQEYEPVWPPTLMMNKATALDDRHQTLTWGAAQLGIAQGVLDAVADGLLEASGDLLVLVAVWVDPRAADETAVRVANREAVRKAIGTCVNGRDPAAAAQLVERRDTIQSPFYGGE